MKIVFKMNQISRRTVRSRPIGPAPRKAVPVIALPHFDKSKAYWYLDEYRKEYKKL